MKLRYETRNSEYKTYVVDRFPPIETVSTRVSFGLLSWTLLDLKERWIKKSAVIRTQYGVQTGSEVARDYLDFVYPDRLRATGRQAEAITLHRHAPLYLKPGHYREYCYVDVKSAYWSIMQLAGWDVDYFPGKWVIPGRPPFDFPLRENKVARNCLASLALPNPMRLWTGTGFRKQYRRNVHVNFSLWALLMDTLNAIAIEAIKRGAVYVHTDGAILPISVCPAYIAAVASYGLDAQIKHDSRGDAWIFGFGNWRCGERSTKQFGKTDRVNGLVNTIYLPYMELLQRKLKKFSTVLADRWTG